MRGFDIQRPQTDKRQTRYAVARCRLSVIAYRGLPSSEEVLAHIHLAFLLTVNAQEDKNQWL